MGFSTRRPSLRHNRTQSNTITCADHMISRKRYFFELPFFHFQHFIVSIFGADWRFLLRVHPNQSQRDLPNPRELRIPVSPTTWKVTCKHDVEKFITLEANCGAALFLIHFSLFQNKAAFFLFGFSGFAVLGKWRNGYRARVPTVAKPQGESESESEAMV